MEHNPFYVKWNKNQVYDKISQNTNIYLMNCMAIQLRTRQLSAKSKNVGNPVTIE